MRRSSLIDNQINYPGLAYMRFLFRETKNSLQIENQVKREIVEKEKG